MIKFFFVFGFLGAIGYLGWRWKKKQRLKEEQFRYLQKKLRDARKKRRKWLETNTYPPLNSLDKKKYEELWLIEIGAEEALLAFFPDTYRTSYNDYKLEKRNGPG